MTTSLELVFHPAKASPRKAAVLGFALGIAFQALWNALEPLAAVLLIGLLLAQVRDFYLETRYRFDETGVRVEGALKPSRCYPWKRFRAFVEDRNGLFLTPYLSQRSLEQQRGLFLPMTRQQRTEAAGFCRELALVRRSV